MDGVSGRIYYVEVPSSDVQRSATFYQQALGWKTRERGDGAVAFDDSGGNVSGAFVTDRTPADEPGFRIYIGSEDIVGDCERVKTAGGTITLEPDLATVDVVAWFRDPDGNQWGLHQYKPENQTEAD